VDDQKRLDEIDRLKDECQNLTAGLTKDGKPPKTGKNGND